MSESFGALYARNRLANLHTGARFGQQFEDRTVDRTAHLENGFRRFNTGDRCAATDVVTGLDEPLYNFHTIVRWSRSDRIDRCDSVLNRLLSFPGNIQVKQLAGNFKDGSK